MRSLECAPAQGVEPVVYEPPQWARRLCTKGFAGADVLLQPDGIFRCPADHPFTVHERRPERNGSVRIVYGARMTHCRSCPLRGSCQESATTLKPRHVSAVLWPTSSRSSVGRETSEKPAPTEEKPAFFPVIHPVLWGDRERRSLRRQWFPLLRSQTILLTPETVLLEKHLDRQAPERHT